MSTGTADDPPARLRRRADAGARALGVLSGRPGALRGFVIISAAMDSGAGPSRFVRRLPAAVLPAAFSAAVAVGSPPGLLPAGEEAANRMSRGVALLEQFRFRDAADEFARVVELAPDSVAGHVNLGIAWFNERRFDRARGSFERARSLDAEAPHALYNLGLIEKLEGNTEAALEAFRRVAEMDPDDAMTQYYLGAAYAAVGRLDEAETALRAALELQPEHESARFSLGNVLVRAGRREEGRRELEEFQRLREVFAGGGVSAGLQYTELGPYAEAMEESPPPLQEAPAPRPPTGAFAFSERTEAWGLGLTPLPPPAPPVSVSASDYSPEWAARNLLPDLGSGAAFRDFDGDGRPDLAFVRGGRVVLFRNLGGIFEPWDELAVPGAVSVTIGDVDRDGDPDLYVAASGPNALLLNRAAEGGTGFDAAEGSGAEGGEVSVSATFADFDHDGDLDLYTANYAPGALVGLAGEIPVPEGIPGAPNRLYRNDGDGGFTEVGGETRTDGGPRRSLFSLFSDWDDDRDVDFLVVNDGSPVQVFSNDRVGTFTESAEAWGVETAARMRGAASGDFDRDGAFDLALTAEGGALNLLLRGPAGEGFSPDLASPLLLQAGVPGARYGVSFLDADRDLDLDLALVVNEPEAVLALYENTPGGFVRAASVGAGLEDGEEARALALADVDGDGDLDAVAGTTFGRLLAFRNDTAPEANWMAVRARGLRSNLDGLGAKVEVRVGAVSQRREVRSTSGYLSQDDLPLHFGLGEAAAADYVRFLWPGGVKQIELEVPAARVASIEELNRKGTSCPVLYAWDGERTRFVTDFLGGSAIGNLLAPGVFNTPDTAEVVKLESFSPAPRNGAYEFRWVNQLEEVIFYDRASLWIADAPEGVDLFPDERLMPAPPYPPPALVAVRNRRPPGRAVSRAAGRDAREVTDRLLSVDRDYVDDFENLPFKGYAETHHLDLHFEGVRPNPAPVLLLYGWVDYADSSSNLAASQAGVAASPPSLEIADGDGFLPLVPSMGFPAGLPKTMVVPLPKRDYGSAVTLRISTNMRIYWDRIEIAEAAPDAGIRRFELDPDTAELRFAGYPEPHRPSGRPPVEYRYERRRASDTWGAHEGGYTRYGEVRPLLTAVDDRYVIARHGDEILLRFDASAAPPPPPGSHRAFFLLADGFGKDMDLNSARPHTVAPLPFHGMSAYPYPEDEYPANETLLRWAEEYNTRRLGPEVIHGFLDDRPGESPTDAEGGGRGPRAGANDSRERRR